MRKEREIRRTSLFNKGTSSTNQDDQTTQILPFRHSQFRLPEVSREIQKTEKQVYKLQDDIYWIGDEEGR